MHERSVPASAFYSLLHQMPIAKISYFGNCERHFVAVLWLVQLLKIFILQCSAVTHVGVLGSLIIILLQFVNYSLTAECASERIAKIR